jgi:hypothetical protein
MRGLPVKLPLYVIASAVITASPCLLTSACDPGAGQTASPAASQTPSPEPSPSGAAEASPSPGSRLTGEILHQAFRSGREGYTVLRVWGGPYDMGYAQGYLLGDLIPAYIDMMKAAVISASGDPDAWTNLQAMSAAWAFRPEASMSEELAGLRDGVLSKSPGSSLSLSDLETLQRFGDAVTAGCRSHSCWGSYVTSPIKTLSTRRADWTSDLVPSDFAFFHYVLVCYDPDDSSKPRWINVTIPGMLTVNTALSEYGTLASNHDYAPGGTAPSAPILGRSAALRLLISSLGGDLSSHAAAARSLLDGYGVPGHGFINVFTPEGDAAVFDFQRGGAYHRYRLASPLLWGGQAISTTNSYSDGTTAPAGAAYLNAYYGDPSPKTMQSHWDVLADNPPTSNIVSLQVSVAYRGRADMRIWFDGLYRDGRTGKLEYEWSGLFGH